MTDEGWLTTEEATGLLLVKAATLYAYVSRGLVRSEAGPPGTRERRYHRGDVEGLRFRRGARRDPQGAVAQALGGALHWGEPLLDSELTAVAEGRLHYRGQDAVALSDHATVEEVAALLWTGEGGRWVQLPLRSRLNLSRQPRAEHPAEAFAYALAHAGAHDLSAHDTRPDALSAQAARILNLLYATLERHEGLPPAPDLPLHARLARAWGVPEGAELLRRTLVLLADHELDISTFTARVTAGSGGSLHHVALAALCALQGRDHGLSVLDAHELLDHARRVGARAALHDATRRLGRPPGFGHPLYTQGDPRARALLLALRRGWPDAGAGALAAELEALTLAETGERPNLDLALGALAQVLGREPQDSLALFALARATGWLAHALEARRRGEVIRPRARYVGQG